LSELALLNNRKINAKSFDLVAAIEAENIKSNFLFTIIHYKVVLGKTDD
jgi:hypothetical protein